MMRHKFTIGAVALAFAVSAAPVLGQQNPRSGGSGSRSSGGGERSGAAVPRGGSSGGGVSGGGSVGSSSSPSAPSSSGSTMRSPARMGSSSGDRAGAAMRAPRRSDDAQATGRRAVPRGGTASAPAAPATRTGRSTTRTTGEGGGSVDRATGRRAVPVNNRPRGERPVTGQAVERSRVPLPGTDTIFIYRPYYNPWGFYGPGLGYGLGYLYYDPFWYGGYGYGSGYGYYGGGYGSGYYSGSGGYSQTYRDAGALRLKLKPREAEVYVDGYYVGVVDSFDGMFQKLRLDGGGHRVEVRADGYDPLQFDVLITPGETVTYKGEMQPAIK